MPFAAVCHFWSSAFTKAVIGKVRRPAAVFDWTTLLTEPKA
jgi:hypothetical protein